MDGLVENLAGHGVAAMPEDPYGGEQLDPYSDVGKHYNDEPDNQYNEQPGDRYDEGSGNAYNVEQVNSHGDEPVNQYNKELANTCQGELQNAYNGKVGQQENSHVDVDDKRWPGWPGESVFRILVPAQKVGAIIGRKGEFIKKMCEESKARIKILDALPGVLERAVVTAV